MSIYRKLGEHSKNNSPSKNLLIMISSTTPFFAKKKSSFPFSLMQTIALTLSFFVEIHYSYKQKKFSAFLSPNFLLLLFKHIGLLWNPLHLLTNPQILSKQQPLLSLIGFSVFQSSVNQREFLNEGCIHLSYTWSYTDMSTHQELIFHSYCSIAPISDPAIAF